MENLLENFNTNSLDSTTSATTELIDDFDEIRSQSPLEAEITIGMQAMRVAFASEEQNYIEEMLKKHPVVIENRVTSVENNEYGSKNLMQRAAICRKSRINNKTKKAQVCFRHQFANQKLKQSIDLHNHLQEMIADAEKQLLDNGLSPEKLKHMREQFGVGKNQMHQQQQTQPQYPATLSSPALSSAGEDVVDE